MDRRQAAQLNLLKTASIDSKFDCLPLTTQQQADVALYINGSPERATPEILKIMKAPNEFGFWVFHSLNMDTKIKPNKLFKCLSKVLVASEPSMPNRTFRSSVASGFAEVIKAGMDVGAFANEFLLQALRHKKSSSLAPLLGILPGQTQLDIRVQSLILSAFQEKDGFKDLLIKLLTKRELSCLVVEHGLCGFADVISRKDRAAVLSIALGI